MSYSYRGELKSGEKRHGYYDDLSKAYVITDPRTPVPWVNYLGSEHFLAMVSNTGGGFSFHKNPQTHRLTHYRHDSLPVDNTGRYFYIREGGHVWSPGWKPVKTDLDYYRCYHGLGYTRLESGRDKLESEVLFFIPLGSNVEIHRLTLRNRSKRTRQIQVYSYAEWCQWNTEETSSFQDPFAKSEVMVSGSLLYHASEYRKHRNHLAFYGVNRPLSGFDMNRDAFLGPYNGPEAPLRVKEGTSGNSQACGQSPIASHRLDLTLIPGEEVDLTFVLGYVENEEEHKFTASGAINVAKAEALMRHYAQHEQVQAAFDQLAQHWQQLLHTMALESEEGRLNRMLNIWTPYQCMVNFNLSPPETLTSIAPIRFRKACQDLMGVAHLIPQRTRSRLLALANTPIWTCRCEEPGNASFKEAPLWLIVGTAVYVKETGDLSILQEPLGSGTTLLDHLFNGFGLIMRHLGPHGLPLVGSAHHEPCQDQNTLSPLYVEVDGINLPTAESLKVAGLFLWCGEDLAKLCRLEREAVKAQTVEKQMEEMRTAIAQNGWDGRWFLRAYLQNGEKVGSSENREGQIFVEPQGWCIMAGIGFDDGRAERALDSVRAMLSSEYGLTLLYPTYTRYQEEIGNLSSYPPGANENGAVYCHTNPLITIAETMLGRGEEAFEYYRKTAPAYREDKFRGRQATEPFVYSQVIAGKEANQPGTGQNAWLTSAAAWNLFAVSQYILGIRPQVDGLYIDPCIPRGWRGFKITRTFRGATYLIQVKNPAHVCKGVVHLEVDGQLLEGQTIPVQPPGRQVEVKVILG